MLQAPRRSRFRKWHKLRIRKISYSKGGSKFIIGNIGIKALKSCRLAFKPLEAGRRIIARKLKKKSRIWIRPFPYTPLTKKPDEIRMGKGKGAVHSWIHRLEAGKILFELNNVAEEDTAKILRKVGKKLPIPSAIVHRPTPYFKK
jgi:large subunit ribosomal protein L16